VRPGRSRRATLPPVRAAPDACRAPATAHLDAADVARVLKQFVHKLVEPEDGADDLLLLGIPDAWSHLPSGSPHWWSTPEDTERRERGVTDHEGGTEGTCSPMKPGDLDRGR
jgi:hypothetical protein